MIHFEENSEDVCECHPNDPLFLLFHELWNNLIFQVIKLIPLVCYSRAKCICSDKCMHTIIIEINLSLQSFSILFAVTFISI